LAGCKAKLHRIGENVISYGLMISYREEKETVLPLSQVYCQQLDTSRFGSRQAKSGNYMASGTVIAATQQGRAENGNSGRANYLMREFFSLPRVYIWGEPGIWKFG
jgi:hypothetical protein